MPEPAKSITKTTAYIIIMIGILALAFLGEHKKAWGETAISLL